MKTNLFLAVAALLLAFTPPVAFGVVPYLINYQGKLNDASTGEPIHGATIPMAFSIYDTESVGSGTLLWQEEHADVYFENGIYNILLGSATATVGSLDEKLFSSNNRWLEVEVDGEVLSPRQRITSVPYALKAGEADRVPESALTTQMIADGAITSDKIASDEITASHITFAAVGTSEIKDGSVSSSDIDFKYAASDSKGGPATDLDCSACVSQTELDPALSFGDITAVYAGNGLSGGSSAGDVYLDVVGPLTLSTSNWKYSAINGTQTNPTGGFGVYGANTGYGNFGYLGSISYGVRGEHSNGNWGYLGSISYGVRGGHNNGNYGNLGGQSYGVMGYNDDSGNYGYLGSSSRGVHGYSVSGTAGHFYSVSGYGLIVSRGYVGLGTTSPISELQVAGRGDVSELTISPDGDNETSILKMCQDKDCDNASIWRYDGIRNSLYLYFKDSGGSGFDDDRERISFKVEHHGNSDARIGINLPKGHDIKNVLEVGGKILAQEIEVVAQIADYVFDDGFDLMALEEVESYIDKNRHLPGVPSGDEVMSGGGTVPLGQAYTNLLQKIEELTLYTIQQNNTLKTQQSQMEALGKEIGQLRKRIASMRK